jgi:UDP-N-acetylglucosamine transferase subunit ALG13
MARRILVAPLNWGLGHATRCIPLIEALADLGASVFLASDGVALQLLRAEFPGLPTFELPSYGIHYRTANMIRNMAGQTPRILWAIRREKSATERLARHLNLSGILSDNRYGCFSRTANSVLLTHQLHLRIPNAALQWSANGLLHRAFAKFDALWVPDASGEPNLSGALSHSRYRVHPRVHFAGILTRMSQGETTTPGYRAVIVLSGPEPQRTILETRLIEQALELPGRFMVVQGQPAVKKHYFAADNVEVISYLTSRDLNAVLADSEAIICRSGYSSLMDLAALGKKAILIPTPGQTEQEYLADYLAEQGTFLVQHQDHIDLKAGLDQLSGTTGFVPGQFPSQDFRPLLTEWYHALPDKS